MDGTGISFHFESSNAGASKPAGLPDGLPVKWNFQSPLSTWHHVDCKRDFDAASSLLEYGIETARGAGTVAMRWFQSDELVADGKADGSPVTQADRAAERFVRDAIARAKGPVVCVSNEVGLGIVPASPLGREFRDAAGRLNQNIAAQADRVEFIAAGLPLTLKKETS